MEWFAKRFELNSIGIEDRLKLDEGIYSFAQKAMAVVAKSTDKMLLDAIMQTAKEKGITDLYVLNEDFIMDAIREKMEREAKKEE